MWTGASSCGWLISAPPQVRKFIYFSNSTKKVKLIYDIDALHAKLDIYYNFDDYGLQLIQRIIMYMYSALGPLSHQLLPQWQCGQVLHKNEVSISSQLVCGRKALKCPGTCQC